MKKINQNQKIWDHFQTDQREVFKNSYPRFKFILNLIKKQKKNGKVLDVGLGDGYLLKILAKNNYECFGIDIAKESINANAKEFKKQNLTIKLKEGNINKIPFANDSFDFITASEVLEHLDDKDLALGIKEISRCLKKNSVFIGTVPANENLKENICFCPYCKKKFHRWGHKQSFTKKKLTKLLSPYFKDLKIYKKPLILKSNLIEKIKTSIKWGANIFWPELISGSFIIIAKK